ncbi:recombinase family protein [Bradyrhizobium sp. USDA 4515]
MHRVLTNPFYAGVYVYGRTQQTCYLDAGGRIRKRIRQRDREQWPVFIRDHHAGYIDWNTFEAIQKRLAQNIRPRPHQSGGAVREGAALLQGLAVCGHCGRRLAVHYSGRFSAPGYHGAGKNIVNGRGEYCLNIGGVQIDAAVAEAFLAALAPAGLESSLQTIEQFDADHKMTLAQFRRDVERARYNAQRAERRYRAVDPENRLVARRLEGEWESALLELRTAESELSDRGHALPRSLTHEERDAILALGKDLKRIWFAPMTSDRDRKELLRTLLDDVTLRVERDKYNDHLTLRWRGGLFSEVNVPLPHSHPSPIRTADDTIDVLRRPGCTLSRHQDRRHPQSPRPYNGHRTVVYGKSCVEPADALGHPVLPAETASAGRRLHDNRESSTRSQERTLYFASLPQRWLHCRRADHTWRAVAHPYQ